MSAKVVVLAQIIGEVVKESKEAPSGVIYAALMSVCTLEEYQNALEMLIKTKQIRQERSHLLVWIGA